MEHFYELKKLASLLGISPFYVVAPFGGSSDISDAQSQLLQMWLEGGSVACMSPVQDLIFEDTALRYDWAGRGCCVVFCRNIFSFSMKLCLGLGIHEAGHYLDLFDHPARNAVNRDNAIQLWKSTDSAKYDHGPRWLRATVHLWHRACRMGYEIPFDDVLDLGKYGFDRSDLLPLLDEASNREGESIESIIGTSAAVVGAVTAPSARPLSSRERAKAIGIKGPWMAWVEGRLVQWRGGTGTVDGQPVSDATIGEYRRKFDAQGKFNSSVA